jgi:predicted esterase
MNLTNITVFAKSAGAGACIHMASWNHEIKYLFLSCPGTNSLGTPLADRKDLPIKLAWNKDDDQIPYKIHETYVKNFEKQGNNYTFDSYDVGGHEFNKEFLMKL